MVTATQAINLPPAMADKVNRNNAQLGQLSEVMHVMRLDKQNALVRRLVKKHQDGTLGQAAPEVAAAGGEEAGGDDMAEDDKVNFGDTTTHNVYTVAEAAGKATGKVASSLIPVILAAALGGGGLGAAAMATAALMKKADTVVVQPVANPDDGLQYLLEFSEKRTEGQ